MSDKNPFIPGDRVVCICDNWVLESGPGISDLPKKGEVLLIDLVNGRNLHFEKYGLGNGFDYRCFAPAQDATEMESEETEFVHYEEMAAHV